MMPDNETLLNAALAHRDRALAMAAQCRHLGTAEETRRALAWARLWTRLADRYFVACYGPYLG